MLSVHSWYIYSLPIFFLGSPLPLGQQPQFRVLQPVDMDKITNAKAKPNMAWLRHQMETFSVLLALRAGNSPVTGEFPSQRPTTQSFDVFFDQRQNKRLVE